MIVGGGACRCCLCPRGQSGQPRKRLTKAVGHQPADQAAEPQSDRHRTVRL